MVSRRRPRRPVTHSHLPPSNREGRERGAWEARKIDVGCQYRSSAIPAPSLISRCPPRPGLDEAGWGNTAGWPPSRSPSSSPTPPRVKGVCGGLSRERRTVNGLHKSPPATPKPSPRSPCPWGWVGVVGRGLGASSPRDAPTAADGGGCAVPESGLATRGPTGQRGGHAGKCEKRETPVRAPARLPQRAVSLTTAAEEARGSGGPTSTLPFLA